MNGSLSSLFKKIDFKVVRQWVSSNNRSGSYFFMGESPHFEEDNEGRVYSLADVNKLAPKPVETPKKTVTLKKKTQENAQDAK